MRSIQIGIKSTHEWIGEDLLIAENPLTYKFEYSVVAQTKLTTYEINFQDLSKIPLEIRD